jgi:hypothetical protein
MLKANINMNCNCLLPCANWYMEPYVSAIRRTGIRPLVASNNSKLKSPFTPAVWSAVFSSCLLLVFIPHRRKLLVLPKEGARQHDEQVEVWQQWVRGGCSGVAAESCAVGGSRAQQLAI